MTITIKLNQATYTVRMEAVQMVLECTTMGIGRKDGESKLITSTLGYYGPGQIQHAISRIIAEETTLDNERVHLREFLIKYKAIHESISGQVEEIKEQIKQSRSK